MAKEIIRKCVGCNNLKNREELIKITRENETNAIFINPNAKTFGRSVYLCYNSTCIEGAIKKNKLARFLKAALTEDFKATLRTFHKEKTMI